MRVAGAALAALGGVVEALLGHLVDAIVLPGHEWRADRADRAGNAHIDAGLGDPLWAIRTVLDIGHAVLELAGRLRDEQFGRQPRQVEVAIGRNPTVLHGASSAAA